MGHLLRGLFASRSWRRLGYQDPAHYARERLGLSLSSVEHRVTLARRVARHSQLGAALEEGAIGYEAALLVGRVVGRNAGDALVAAWIDRAKRRTAKHLREEVAAVLLAVEFHSETSRLPPATEDVEAAADLERKVQSGALLRSALREHTAHDVRAPQMSVPLACESRRAIHLTLSPELYAHWLDVEAEYRALDSPHTSFVAFLCASLWTTWLPFLEAWDDKWRHVYLRDRHRCTSPVCERRDVTPHHVHFRAHGGTDELENMTSECSWCHLRGIHRGRLRAAGSASSLLWMIGRDPILVVNGREKNGVAAA
jgi:hypothetical protein